MARVLLQQWGDALPCSPPHHILAKLSFVAQVARTAADCKMEMDVEEYVDSFRPGGW